MNNDKHNGSPDSEGNSNSVQENEKVSISLELPDLIPDPFEASASPEQFISQDLKLIELPPLPGEVIEILSTAPGEIHSYNSPYSTESDCTPLREPICGEGCVLHGNTRSYTLGKGIAVGGEGAVYEVLEDRRLVAKVYRSTISEKALASRSEKIQSMIDNPVFCPNRNGFGTRLVWPIEKLTFQNSFCGFLMPRVPGIAKPLNEVILSKNRPWDFKLYCCLNLARLVSNVHNSGHIIGDFNPTNFFVSADSTVVAIDTDAYTIYDARTDRLYKCTVGIAEYVLPGLTSGFTKDSDRFALAIILFRLLMDGYHPFHGKKANDIEVIPFMRKRVFPYDPRCEEAVTPDGAPTLDRIPVKLRRLFLDTFSNQSGTSPSMPTAERWCEELLEVINGDDLIRCNHDHVYARSCKRCPWCKE